MDEDLTLPPPAVGDEATQAAAPGGPRIRGVGPMPGDRIGHFEVLHRLGAGAMGVVLAAYDPNLDRQVAIKLLKAGGMGTLTQAGRCDEAVPVFRRSIAINETALDGDHPEHAFALTGLGRCLLVGDAPGALAVLTRARELRERDSVPVPPADRGFTRWLFAQAAWASGQRESAIEAATGAVEDFADAPGYEAVRAEVNAWLESR